jgi:hypothetical protein
MKVLRRDPVSMPSDFSGAARNASRNAPERAFCIGADDAKDCVRPLLYVAIGVVIGASGVAWLTADDDAGPRAERVLIAVRADTLAAERGWVDGAAIGMEWPGTAADPSRRIEVYDQKNGGDVVAWLYREPWIVVPVGTDHAAAVQLYRDRGGA